MTSKFQMTLALIKPDALSNPLVVQGIHQMLLKEKFIFVRSKSLQMTKHQAENFYKEHKGRFFYDRLVTYMTGGPIMASILCRENCISYWRQIMGSTKVYKTIYDDPESIRGSFGLTDTRNCTHGSDSEESAAKEISYFFPEFNIDEWYRTMESSFKSGELIFNETSKIHELLDRPTTSDHVPKLEI